MKKLSIHLYNQTKLKNICKSISALDAIVCPEWEFRYFSYQKNWDKDEECCEIRDGQGSQLLILFQEDSVCINGFSKKSIMNECRNELVNNLPKQFYEFIFGEPVQSIGTTFCIWSINAKDCKTGYIGNYEESLQDLLNFLDGVPITYKNWAEFYYEVKLNLDVIKMVYNGNVLTKDMITKIDPNFNHYRQLKKDLEDIGYPYEF